MNGAERMRAAMVEQLIAAGSLRSQPWIDAFKQVPREAFLRRFFQQSPDLSGWEPVSSLDPGTRELIYTNNTWVTQLDNDPDRWHTARDSGKAAQGIPTSSSTTPGLMALMLEALDVRDGHRLLEIGTGTGYNAALLSHRLGSSLVTTMEVDQAVADAAGAALYAGGYSPTVAVADGTGGYPNHAPYDRLIATCSTPTIPAAWVAQTRPGGVILSSLFRDLGGGPLVLLHVDSDGRAEGRFLPDYGGFMPVRASPPADTLRKLDTALAESGAEHRPTALSPDLLDSSDFGMVAALRLPGVASIGFTPATGPQRWLLGDDGSWACVDATTSAVSQRGTRRLWDEIEDTHQQWTDAGTPARDRYGLTVSPNRQWVWLDEPANPVPTG